MAVNYAWHGFAGHGEAKPGMSQKFGNGPDIVTVLR